MIIKNKKKQFDSSDQIKPQKESGCQDSNEYVDKKIVKKYNKKCTSMGQLGGHDKVFESVTAQDSGWYWVLDDCKESRFGEVNKNKEIKIDQLKSYLISRYNSQSGEGVMC